MPGVTVDTYKLKSYADRLETVNSRIVKLDGRLDRLYWQVGLQGLFSLIQADALTGFSWRLLRCKGYLSQTAVDFEKTEKKLASEDPLTFSKPPVSGIKEVIYDVGVGVKKAASKVKSIAEKTITSVFDSYNSHGTVYKVVQYGKAVLKAAKGVGKIVVGVGSLFGSGGLSAPVAALSILSGVNDLHNAIMDGAYTYTEEYDKIGKTNLLKDALTENAGQIGEYFGNRKAGETVGKVTYYGMDLVTSLATLEVSLAKVKQLPTTNYSQVGHELKEIANMDVSLSKILSTDVETLKYEAKLASYSFSETTKVVANAKALKDVVKKTYKVGKNVNSIFTVNAPDGWENPVIKTVDSYQNLKSTVGKAAKCITKGTKFVFG